MKKSMSDLLLKAHFNDLKEELNKAIRSSKNEDDDELVKVLKKTFNYLKKKAEESSLDDRGVVLYNDIACVLDDISSGNYKPNKDREDK
ncbi:hypothetical protein [Fulvivirga lutimaris]|uniref:hypothetical protein n=1 Tax=Fulvivirga lutimaris TaxID=1819566 RepID=UPI0012BC4C3B|nr:hypothetical protein [Fulvivirga lutimaris]MTI39449.1 hypothetical protein [Fulvivirga lutimaris]